jgi:MFS transporter, CP family, cyanate transporter
VNGSIPNKSRLRAPILLWLAGVVLRITILAIAPVIPLIQRDLHMSGTQVGILSGLPTLMLALAALLGAFAMSRFSAFATLIGGLVFVALGTILRGTAQNITVLFGTTVIMSTGVAVAQPTLAVLVREWLPRQIGFGTASYANGLIVGGIIPIALMLPVVMPLLADSWRLAVAVWAAPVLFVMIILLLFAPRSSARGAINVLTRADWFSLDYNLIWRIGLIFGANNSIFFGTNAFLPSYLTSIGKSDLISVALTVYNFCQLPSSLLVFAFASRLERRIWPYLFAGLIAIASIAFTISGASSWIVLSIATLGFASGITLTLGLALPPLLSAPAQIGTVSAAMFMLSYTYAMMISVCGGVLWDLTGRAGAALAMVGTSILPLFILVPTIHLGSARGERIQSIRH